MADVLLEVRHLKVQFKGDTDSRQQQVDTVVDEISFSVYKGEILGIVGESGSGKSMTALAILGLLRKEAEVVSGEILFEGKDILQMTEEEQMAIKGSLIAMIFQEPMTSLNPVMKIGTQVDEMVMLHEKLPKDEIKQRTLEAFEEVGFEDPKKVYESYPHQLSGGMRQRVMIAMAMINRPKLLIADEPTTALDVTVQARILRLIEHLNKKYHMAVILVSHDLGVIQKVCNRAVVMWNGKVVEEGTVSELFHAPKEEYTKQLIAAIPKRNKTNNTQYIEEGEEILSVENLVVSYDSSDSFFDKLKSNEKRKEVIHDLSLRLKKGEILGIVGESGCGKTTLMKSILGMIKIESGKIYTHDKKIRMVFQDPYSSLNPVKKIGWLLEEPLRFSGKLTKEKRKKKVIETLEAVGLSGEYMVRKPKDLSGGQRQRVAIAMAIITKPDIVILDEPVSSLDVTVQAQILELLVNLRNKYQLSYIFISHDLNVISQICDRAMVMYKGRIVEEGSTAQLFDEPKNSYTKELLENIIQ